MNRKRLLLLLPLLVLHQSAKPLSAPIAAGVVLIGIGVGTAALNNSERKQETTNSLQKQTAAAQTAISTFVKKNSIATGLLASGCFVLFMPNKPKIVGVGLIGAGIYYYKKNQPIKQQ